MSFCRCQCLADSIEGEFMKKKMKTAALLEKMLKRVITIFFPISILPFSTKIISRCST